MVDLGFFTQIYQSLVSGLASVIGPGTVYPYGTLTIVAVSVLMATISSLATRSLVDVELMRRRMTEVKEWQSAYSKAVRAKDQKQIEKLKKRQQAINNLQGAMTKDNFKPMLVTIIPFGIFYYLFYGVFDYNQTIVAYSPIDLPYLGTTLVFWSFYFICSFGIYGFMNRLFNLPSAPD